MNKSKKVISIVEAEPDFYMYEIHVKFSIPASDSNKVRNDKVERVLADVEDTMDLAVGEGNYDVVEGSLWGAPGRD